LAIAAIFAVCIGLLLGLLGGGGSILTVPVLVFTLNFSAKDAIVTSLIIVAITSAIAMISHARKGCVCWKTGLTFSVTGVMGAFLGGRISASIPDDILLLLFAIVMLIASFYMLRSKSSETINKPVTDRLCPDELPFLAIFFDGFMVGVITGLVGVGGGFLLVPALSFLVGLPIHAAIGTSLLIITLQSIAALVGHANAINFDPKIVALFSVLAVIGSLIGSHLTQKISSQHLKKAFGIFVLLIACFMIYKDFNQEMIHTIRELYFAHKEFILGAITMIIAYIFYQIRIMIHTRYLLLNQKICDTRHNLLPTISDNFRIHLGQMRHQFMPFFPLGEVIDDGQVKIEYLG